MARGSMKGSMRDTEYLLEQWGSWRMVGMGVPRYVSPSFALMRDNVEQLDPVSYCITDDCALMVDRCVAELTAREQRQVITGPKMGDCIWLYFGAKWPAVRVGRHFGVSEAKARELIKAGVAWVDSRLDLLVEAA